MIGIPEHVVVGGFSVIEVPLMINVFVFFNHVKPLGSGSGLHRHQGLHTPERRRRLLPH